MFYLSRLNVFSKILLVFSILFFTSCQKNPTAETQNQGSKVEDSQTETVGVANPVEVVVVGMPDEDVVPDAQDEVAALAKPDEMTATEMAASVKTDKEVDAPFEIAALTKPNEMNEITKPDEKAVAVAPVEMAALTKPNETDEMIKPVQRPKLETTEVEGEGCNEDNYEDYVFDLEKITDLIERTGRGCQLQGAKLHSARLKNAYLQKADLTNASLRYADLRGANLEEAKVMGADLRTRKIEGANFKLAEWSETTQFNSGRLYGLLEEGEFKPEVEGMILADKE